MRTSAERPNSLDAILCTCLSFLLQVFLCMFLADTITYINWRARNRDYLRYVALCTLRSIPACLSIPFPHLPVHLKAFSLYSRIPTHRPASRCGIPVPR